MRVVGSASTRKTHVALGSNIKETQIQRHRGGLKLEKTLQRASGKQKEKLVNEQIDNFTALQLTIGNLTYLQSGKLTN